MPTDLEQELERTTAMRGWRYGLHDFTAAVMGVEELRRHNDHDVAWGKPQKGLVDHKTRRLIRVVALCAEGGPSAMLQCFLYAAHKAGWTPEELLEVINITRGSVGSRGIMALEAWRAVFRPELPPVDRVVELR